MFEALQEIDNVDLNLGSGGSHLINITIAFIMFGVALELHVDDFRKLLRQPKPALIGVISQFVLLPVLTFLLALAMGDYITPTVGLGMILVASCPGGNVSNFISGMARGNLALSVSLTAISTSAGVLFTPLNFAFWGNLYIRFYNNPGATNLVRDLNVDLWTVFQTIVLILGLPLIIGIMVNHRYPNFTLKVVVGIKRFSILVFLGMVAVLFGMNFEYFLKYIYYIFLIVIVHNGLALSSAYYFAKISGLDLRNRKTISIETGIQNSGLAIALLINPNIFPESLAIGGMLFIAAWWGIWHIIAGLTVAGFWSGFSLRPNSGEADL